MSLDRRPQDVIYIYVKCTWLTHLQSLFINWFPYLKGPLRTDIFPDTGVIEEINVGILLNYKSAKPLSCHEFDQIGIFIDNRLSFEFSVL